MSLPSQPKLIVYLAAIFLAGGVAGGFLGYQLREDRRPPHRRPPTPDQMIEFVREKLVTDIGVSDAQWSQIAPIITNSTRQIMDADARNRERIGELIKQSDARIMEILSDEQKPRMQAWIDERFKHHEKGSPRQKPGEK